MLARGLFVVRTLPVRLLAVLGVVAILAGLAVPSPAAAATGVTVSGRVVSESNPALGVSAGLRLVQENGDDVAWAQTDSDGYYSFTVESGSYRLLAEPYDAGYVRGRWLGGIAVNGGGGSNDWRYGSTLIQAVNDPVQLQPLQIPAAGSMRGTVRNAAGQPLPGIEVLVIGPETQWADYSTTTNALGAWRVDGLASGKYHVVYLADGVRWWSANDGNQQPYVDTWYPDSETEDGAEWVSLAAGQNRSGLDVVMPSGATLTGRIVDETGAGFPGDPMVGIDGGPDTVVVRAERDGDGYTSWAWPDASGNFAFTNLPAGTWRTSTYERDPNVDRAWIGGGQDRARATQATLTSEGSFDLGTTARPRTVEVTATVVDDDGDAVPNTRMTLFRIPSSDDTMGSTQYSTMTDETGFAHGFVAAGTYRAEFTYDYGPYAPRVFANVDVSADDGAHVDLGVVDVTREPALTGAVTSATGDPMANAVVSAYRVDESGNPGEPRGSTGTDAAGVFSLGGLGAGDYWLRVRANGDRFWLTDETGNPRTVAVVHGEPPLTVDISAPSTIATSTLSGTVTDDQGAALRGATVNLYPVSNGGSGEDFWATKTTGAAGTWSVTNVPAGIYDVYVVPPSTSTVTRDGTEGVYRLAAGTGTPPAPILTSFSAGATISGRVVDTAGAPVPNLWVSSWISAGGTSVRAKTGADGSYAITGLSAGPHGVMIEGGSQWQQTNSIPDADLTAGGGHAVADIVVVVPGSITGTITDFDGGPVAGAAVRVFGAATHYDAATDENGVFLIEGLTPRDDYLIAVTAPAGSSLRDMWWESGSVRDPQSIRVESGVMTQADMMLRPLDPAVENQIRPGAVTLGGTVRVGSPVTVSTTPWSPSGVTLSYQWLRDDQAIAGATGATYTPVPADAGKRLAVTVTGARDGSEPASVTSVSTVVAAGVLTSATPTISGTPTVGQTLTGKPGTWSPGVSLSYQWLRNGTVIDSARAATYVLTPADAGAKIAVAVTGKLTGYADATKTSATTSTVAKATLTPGVPTLTGTAQVGKYLTAQPGTWNTGTAFTYQWLRNGTAISGATASTYTLTAADVGQKISVKVTGKLAGYTDASKTSAATTAIAKGTLTAATPTITGTLKTGQKLTANRGTWTTGTAFTYQWLRNGTAISGATASTYTLTAADVGQKISVKVTGKLAGYTDASKTSAATTAIAKGTLTAATPTITGTLKAGQKLTAVPGTWTSGTAFTYQWLRNGTAITGATASTYTLTSADRGKNVSVKVTGTKAGYVSLSKTSAAKAIAQ